MMTVIRYYREDSHIYLVGSVNPFSVKGAAYYQKYAVNDVTKCLCLITEDKYSSEQDACAYFDSQHEGSSNV